MEKPHKAIAYVKVKWVANAEPRMGWEDNDA